LSERHNEIVTLTDVEIGIPHRATENRRQLMYGQAILCRNSSQP
jgi:hypothetical protein